MSRDAPATRTVCHGGRRRPSASITTALDERDSEAVKRWLRPLVEAYGVEVVVSDALGSYRKVAHPLGLAHGVCTFHRMRWALRELRKLREEVGRAWLPAVEAALAVVRSRAPDGGRRWMELGRRMKRRLRRLGKRSPPERLRLRLARLGDLGNGRNGRLPAPTVRSGRQT